MFGSLSALYKGLGPIARRTVTGAGIGAGWGMASDDTSVIGGAMMGAGIGAGVGYGGSLYRNPAVRRAWNTGAGMGVGAAMRGAGQAAGAIMSNDARAAGRFIGRTGTRAYNYIRGIGH